MPRAEDQAAARSAHEHAVADLAGRRILDVTYWDVDDFGHGRDWDFGDRHLAVMGVELTTAAARVAGAGGGCGMDDLAHRARVPRRRRPGE
jgi:hypothetical protein